MLTSWDGEAFRPSGLLEIPCKSVIEHMLYVALKCMLIMASRLAKWIALKIATADSTSSSREISTLQSLQLCGASDYIPKLLDYFTHTGPNGLHQCLVSELMGPSVDTVVADYHTGGDRLEAETILTVSRQLLQAIVSVHEAGYGHGGRVLCSSKLLQG